MKLRFLQFVGIYCLLQMATLIAAPITLIKNSPANIVFSFTVPAYTIQDKNINGQNCSYISIPGASVKNQKGSPELPFFVQSVMVPGNGTIDITISSVKSKTISINTMVPSRGVIYRDRNPAYVLYSFGPVYQTDAPYPAERAELGEPYIIRNTRGVSVYFNPFQYNPVRGELTVTETMTVTITTTGGLGGAIAGVPNKTSAMFNNMYASHFVNYQPTASRSVSNLGDGDAMIVITTAEFASAMQPLVAWKNTMGIATTLFTYPSETGGPGRAALRTFIREKYLSDNITYILLVGDAEDIPPDTSFYGDSDPTYTKIVGNDNYGDALIGRFAVSTPEEAAIVVAKNNWYEQMPDETGAWYHKVLAIGGDDEEESGLQDWQRVEQLRPVLMDYTYTVFDTIYHLTARASQVTNSVNDGRGLALYIGHGTDLFWGTSLFSAASVSTLTNTKMPPAIISVACSNGNFREFESCFAEAWQRHGTVDAPAGSILFCGSSILQSWVPPCVGQRETIELLKAEDVLSFGAAFVNGEFSMMAQEDSSVDVYDTWLLFGDPSLVLNTDTPKKVTVTAPSIIDTGLNTIPLTFSAPLDGRIGISGKVHGYLASTIISDTEKVLLPATIPIDETNVTITVTGRNIMPITRTYTVGQNSIAYNSRLPVQNAVHLRQNGRSLMVQTASSERHTVTLWNVNGRKLVSYTINEPHVWHTFPLPTAAGMHLVTVATKNNSTVIKRFTIR